MKALGEFAFLGHFGQDQARSGQRNRWRIVLYRMRRATPAGSNHPTNSLITAQKLADDSLVPTIEN